MSEHMPRYLIGVDFGDEDMERREILTDPTTFIHMGSSTTIQPWPDVGPVLAAARAVVANECGSEGRLAEALAAYDSALATPQWYRLDDGTEGVFTVLDEPMKPPEWWAMMEERAKKAT